MMLTALLMMIPMRDKIKKKKIKEERIRIKLNCYKTNIKRPQLGPDHS